MQTIAVIGTGNMGRGLAKVLHEAGYAVHLGSRDATRAAQAAEEVGRGVTGLGNTEAVRNADVIILAIPFEQDSATLRQLRPHVAGKIVIDIANPLNASFDGLTTSPETSAAELTAQQLPESRVVGAFKNTLAAVFHNPVFDGQQSTVFVAGDDEDAKQTVLKLVDSLPFMAIDAGSLAAARTLEHMSVLLIQVSQRHQYNWRAAYRILS